MAGTWQTITTRPRTRWRPPCCSPTARCSPRATAPTRGTGCGPPASGDYVNGTWTTLASSTEAPLDTRRACSVTDAVIYSGGEYDGFSMVFLATSEIYDPIANTWTLIPAPPGWTAIGDSPGCVLPDGRWFVGGVGPRRTAIYDPGPGTWTAAADKISNVSEEGWSLLPDGSILAIDATDPPNAEKYVIAANTWVPAGSTPQSLVDAIRQNRRPGAAARRPGVRHRRHRCSPPSTRPRRSPTRSARGWPVPTIPQVSGQAARHRGRTVRACSPTARCCSRAGPITSPATFQAPSTFFEYDPADQLDPYGAPRPRPPPPTCPTRAAC